MFDNLSVKLIEIQVLRKNGLNENIDEMIELLSSMHNDLDNAISYLNSRR